MLWDFEAANRRSESILERLAHSRHARRNSGTLRPALVREPDRAWLLCERSTRFVDERVDDNLPELNRPSIASQQNRTRIGFIGV